MEVRRRTTAGGGAARLDDSKSSSNGYTSLDEERKTKEQLGFRHWLLVVLYIGVIYGGVIYLHRRMPPVVDDPKFERFSETHARNLLKDLTKNGPRPSGSHNLENIAFNVLRHQLDLAAKNVSAIGVNRFELDVQRPTGCFDLKFLSSFTLCYEKITNLVVRLGPKGKPSDSALLLNCHFDTMPDTPGATDDAVSCTIMMEVLNVLAHTKESLQNDVIFLFNGAEENFLQGAHGFIEKHPWRHSIKAFINLEGTGSGGREILFQAGPGNSWLLQTYLEAAPHPFCSVLAQEVFQSGVIPSDTDFRIFRDYGRASGLDIAYTKNGWVYHTEFDEEWRIEPGAIQRAGENVLAVVKRILSSPYLRQAATFDEGNRWVFYDVVGLFSVYYSISIGQILNFGAVVATFVLIFFRFRTGVYGVADIFEALVHHLFALLAMIVTMFAIIALVINLDMVMCWYSLPEAIGGLYVLPMMITGAAFHSYFASTTKMRAAEMVHCDSVLFIFSCLLFTMTAARLASAFFIFNYVLFPLAKDPLIWLFGKFGMIKRVTPNVVFFAQLVCYFPLIVFAVYAITQCIDFFVPVMGRLGNAVNPEFVMGPLALGIAYTFVLFTCNLIYISRRMNYVLKVASAVFLLFFVAMATTSLGYPYKYSHENPRLRRVIILHATRTVHNFDGGVKLEDTGLFIQSLDYRGVADLPQHSFLSGSEAPSCNHTQDEYCQLPYYTAIHELFPPSHSRWIAVPSVPRIPYPIELKMIKRERVGERKLRFEFELRGGFDKMSLHITPLDNYELSEWSFTPMNLDTFGRRKTYFVFLTYGFERPEVRTFWIELEDKKSAKLPDPAKQPNLEIAVASHHAHGENQNSDTLLQLRELIKSRRKGPQQAIGWWKWGITVVGGTSEIVIHQY
ncbi:unnamed protein product, partial [Mesorhabditis belari]|uniref:FXNA-like protease n=1 Tax=Mesorhabditis belari TaxID=2138241 RepID=A0AAF3J4D7_9BILA